MGVFITKRYNRLGDVCFMCEICCLTCARSMFHTVCMSTFLDQTLELARRSRRPVTEICRDAGLQPRWYYLLLSGEIKDPGVHKVQSLHDALIRHREAA